MEKEAKSTGRWAPLSSLIQTTRAIERVMNRPGNLPGFAVVHARYGSGKSMALTWAQNRYEGFLLTCKSHFSRKSFCLALLREMDIKPARTMSEMMDQIAEELDKSGRPLLLDDVHRISSSTVLGLILDLHQSARTTIVMAGDERFPALLRRYDEQLYSRVLVWQQIPPVSAEDARRLAAFYCLDRDGRAIEVADDLLAHFRRETRGNARLICINLDDVRAHCVRHGIRRIGLADWQEHRRSVYTGDAPAAERETTPQLKAVSG